MLFLSGFWTQEWVETDDLAVAMAVELVRQTPARIVHRTGIIWSQAAIVHGFLHARLGREARLETSRALSPLLWVFIMCHLHDLMRVIQFVLG